MTGPLLRERLMGHYRLTPNEINRLSFRDAYSMYVAALISEMRTGAYVISAQANKSVQEIAPGCFPEIGTGRRVFSQEQIDHSQQQLYERRAREFGITVEEAEAQWHEIRRAKA